ncbi:hypothetical protein FC99_GL001223 [Levilactobacillus koreensis JCM 16448]|uniref:D-alanyl-D-alanine carboxypeptidase n=1 Tax=Levilactobacillus koreensis TaxID=637971 RepID=A0AAC8UW22_9LACO|nr:hypothetical protein [Levilactobacillus koreensis]AKP65081.1 hypothetical protein ABN16_08765 [Levilactobacillus koreensis]KRK86682.1 hypothetical protein FC99_GL001223 [Levilactobacillus koreensis JCM 16448]
MKRFVKGIIAVGISAGLLGSLNTTASASSQYSASRSNSVRLVWRTSMGRHAMTATHGSRYSKHLGTWYGYNSSLSDVTWVTNAHEKLYDVVTGKYLIYYHVNSADGQHGGWIWRGYLKPAASNPATPTTSTMNWTAATQAAGLQPADISLMKLFPHATYDAKLMAAVNQVFAFGDNQPILTEQIMQANNDFNQVLTANHDDYSAIYLVRFKVTDPNNLTEVKQAVATALDAKGQATLQRWQIAGKIAPLGIGTQSNYLRSGMGLLVFAMK